jgi:hypothetical protein
MFLLNVGTVLLADGANCCTTTTERVTPRRLFLKKHSKAFPIARMDKNVVAVCFPKTLNGNQAARVGVSAFSVAVYIVSEAPKKCRELARGRAECF